MTRDDGVYDTNPDVIVGWQARLSQEVGRWTFDWPCISVYHPIGNESGRKTEVVIGLQLSAGF